MQEIEKVPEAGEIMSYELAQKMRQQSGMDFVARFFPLIPGIDEAHRFGLRQLGILHLGVKVIAQNRGKVLALEEKKTFLMNKEEAVRIADDSGISIVVI